VETGHEPHRLRGTMTDIKFIPFDDDSLLVGTRVKLETDQSELYTVTACETVEDYLRVVLSNGRGYNISGVYYPTKNKQFAIIFLRGDEWLPDKK